MYLQSLINKLAREPMSKAFQAAVGLLAELDLLRIEHGAASGRTSAPGSTCRPSVSAAWLKA
jgi:hypothetical protein